MIDSQHTGIPIWVVRCSLSREYHDVAMCSGVDCVVLAPHVICSVMYLHRLNSVDCVVRNNDRVSLFVREHVVAVADIELAQPIQNVIFKFRYKILKSTREYNGFKTNAILLLP